MGDACVEGHRKKAKYLLDEAELGTKPHTQFIQFVTRLTISLYVLSATEALKTNQSPHTPQDKVQPTPPAQVTVPVSTPQPAQPVLQQPSGTFHYPCKTFLYMR